MKLKICGIRTPEMASACREYSVDYMGFNFVDTSPRRIYEDEFEALASNSLAAKVGVFQNHSVEEIEHILALCDLDILQFHGNESPKIVEHFGQSYETWKVFCLDENFDPHVLKKYKNASAFLFDGTHPGSGHTASAKKLEEMISISQKMKKPFGIAGGINTENIREFQKKFPNALFFDVASGVEENGKFSREKLRKICETSLSSSPFMGESLS